jgi:UDP-2,3-diacylglucosamine pyrophosphatase LpxH
MKHCKSRLIISDLHFPFHHEGVFDFLADILRVQRDITEVVINGDLVDFYGLSFFDKTTQLKGIESELDETRECVKVLLKALGIGRNRTLRYTRGNHEDRLYRRALSAGLDLRMLSDLSKLIGMPVAIESHVFYRKESLYITHFPRGNSLTHATSNNVNLVTGHLHTKAGINFSVTVNKLIFSMQLPCLIDPESLAFSYAGNSLLRPILGCGLISYGVPQLILMPIQENNKGDLKYNPDNLVC